MTAKRVIDYCWNKVTDCLPEANVAVGVWSAGAFEIAEYRPLNEQWVSRMEETTTIIEVTHWMPLPGEPTDG